MLALLWNWLCNRWRRLFLPYLFRHAQRLKLNVHRLTKATVLKKSFVQAHFTEAHAMEFVSRHTTIPIPRVYDYWEDAQSTYLVMEYIHGERLDRIWCSLTDPQKATVMSVIRSYIDQLRAVKQPAHMEGWISTVTGGSGPEHRFSNYLEPCKSVREFHDWRTASLVLFAMGHEPTTRRLSEIRKTMRDDQRVFLTHCDIQKRNILVRVDGDGPEDVEVVALLDWEQCGWRPEYWEKVKMESAYEGNTWKELLPGYEDEYAIEVELQLISGPPL